MITTITHIALFITAYIGMGAIIGLKLEKVNKLKEQRLAKETSEAYARKFMNNVRIVFLFIWPASILFALTTKR
jgi:hypothetical protein